MTPKSKHLISTILMGIPAFVLIIGGVMKVGGMEPPAVVQFLTKAGLGDYIVLLGWTEQLIAALLIYSKTNKIGFLLASCYLGGALCMEIAGAQPPASAFFLALLWIAMFLKDRAMFF